MEFMRHHTMVLNDFSKLVPVLLLCGMGKNFWDGGSVCKYGGD